MNNTQKKVRLKRIEKFGDALAGGLAASAVGVLGLENGNVNIKNVTFAAVLLVTAIVVFGVVTWLAVELAADIEDEAYCHNDEEDG
jgi:hypothetical protein